MTDPVPAPRAVESADRAAAAEAGAKGEASQAAVAPSDATGAGADTATGAPAPDESSDRGIPGGRVVTVATLVVVGAAVAEALLEGRIGPWSGIALVAVSVIAPLVTRRGDRSLPAMMPPLAFLVAVLVAGQVLVEAGSGSWRTRQAVMIAENLGANAPWVIAATALSVTIATVGHLVDRRRRRRAG